MWTPQSGRPGLESWIRYLELCDLEQAPFTSVPSCLTVKWGWYRTTLTGIWGGPVCQHVTAQDRGRDAL